MLSLTLLLFLFPCFVCFRLQEKDTIRLKREAKASGGFYVEPEAKLAFVMRIRGLNKIHPKVRLCGLVGDWFEAQLAGQLWAVAGCGAHCGWDIHGMSCVDWGC